MQVAREHGHEAHRDRRPRDHAEAVDLPPLQTALRGRRVAQLLAYARPHLGVGRPHLLRVRVRVRVWTVRETLRLRLRLRLNLS